MKADNADRSKHVRKLVDARLRYQFFIFFICLVASISFWLLIKLSNEYTLSFKIPVKYTNVPYTRILTGVSDSSIQITLKAQGYKQILLRFIEKPKPLFISLANVEKHKNTEEIISNQILLPLVRRYAASLSFANEVHSVHPEQIRVKMNRLYCKSVPIKLNTDFSFVPQYLQFDPLSVKPSTVIAFGTRKMIDSIEFAQPEVVKVHNMSTSTVRFVHLNANMQVNQPYFIPSLVKVVIPVQKFTEVSVEIPIKLPDQTPGHTIKIFPEKASVSCIVSMNDYKRIDPRLFTVSAVLTKSDNMFHLMVTASPDFVRNIKVTPDKVEYLVLR